MIQFRYAQGAYKAVKGHNADAGVDLRTPISVYIPAGGSATIDTLTMCDIPFGYYGKIESKSGLNVNYDIVSCGGVIDSGYTATIKVKLYNLGDVSYEFKPGDKVAQMIFHKCETVISGIEILDETERGGNGFGSTGK